MNKRGNKSAIVLSFLFIVFSLFIIFEYDPNDSITGYFTANFENTDKYYANQNINGSAILVITAGDKISNDTEFRLGIYDSNNVQHSLEIKSADYIFNKIFNLEKINENSNYYFNKQGSYKLELLNFTLHYDKLGDYKLKFMKNDFGRQAVTLIEKQITLVETPINQSASEIEKTELLGIRFDNDGNFNTFGPEFKRYDLLVCNAKFKSKDKLDLAIYSPNSENEAYREFKDIINSFDNASIFCELDQSECAVLVNITKFQPGNWKCLAKQGDNFKFSNLMTMVGSSPYLKLDIPDFSVDKNGNFSGNTINLNQYFFDPDGEKLQYNIIGAKQLQIIIENGNIIIKNPRNFEGIETVTFRAFDGVQGKFSNTVKITVGSGIGNNDCYPVWDCGLWGECLGGLRIRECNDKNNCGAEIGMPLLSQACDELNGAIGVRQQAKTIGVQNIQVSENFISGSIRYITIIIFIIAILGSAGFLVYWYKFRKNNVVNKEPVQQNQITSNNKSDNSEQLKQYIETMLQQNQPQQKIKDDLINAGWDKNTVSELMNYVTLKIFVKTKLSSGFTKEKIRESLLSKGWKKEIVDKIFSELKI